MNDDEQIEDKQVNDDDEIDQLRLLTGCPKEGKDRIICQMI